MEIQSEDSKELRYKVVKVYADMYLGNGKDNPSITTRLTMVENEMMELKKVISKLGWIVLTTSLTVVGAIIGELVLRSMK